MFNLGMIGDSDAVVRLAVGCIFPYSVSPEVTLYKIIEQKDRDTNINTVKMHDEFVLPRATRAPHTPDSPWQARGRRLHQLSHLYSPHDLAFLILLTLPPWGWDPRSEFPCLARCGFT